MERWQVHLSLLSAMTMELSEKNNVKLRQENVGVSTRIQGSGNQLQVPLVVLLILTA
jgi:hypothetical protein